MSLPSLANSTLPKETGARARVLLRQLLADYAAPGSKHPLTAGPGLEEVFFMPATTSNQAISSSENPEAKIAIVNLTSAFAENHPSGIETETLTLLSIIATLHENFPRVEQVRFLVDGQPRQTLAGHADLTRTYLAGEDEVTWPIDNNESESLSMKIGVFDSGVGGLTVLRALLPRVPNAEYLYLGDTARLPYGSKSQETIARYAVSSSQFLIDQGSEFLVIACNTASALALEEIRQTAEPHGIPESSESSAPAPQQLPLQPRPTTLL